MSKTEQVAKLISECLDRCRDSGFTLATLIHFLDEMRENGQPEVDVQRVGGVMRQILKDILVPGESLAVDLSESSTLVDGCEPTKVVGI